MLSLDALANWEMAVLASIRGATGTINERDAQITRSGMYAEYPAIFSSYLDLFGSSDPGVSLEALKRLVFLAWYSVNASPTTSGIAELPESQVRQVMSDLSWALSSAAADDELRAMLAWYRSRFAYAFEHFGPVRDLDAFVAEVPLERDLLSASITPRAGRGQLGLYWNTVLG